MTIDAAKWLLVPSPTGDGKPWGTGTKMAARAMDSSAPPWDEGCKVTTLIGGYAAMNEMRDALERLISAAGPSTSPYGARPCIHSWLEV